MVDVVVVGVVTVGFGLVAELLWFGVVVDAGSPTEVGGAGVACVGEVVGGAVC